MTELKRNVDKEDQEMKPEKNSKRSIGEILRTVLIVVTFGIATLTPGLGSAQRTNTSAEDELSADSLATLISAAKRGDVDTQVLLGRMYHLGEGVAENQAEAVRWFRAAAEQGNAAGQDLLGYMYAIGMGVPENDAEAVRWYRAAAEQGNADAQASLGVMYAGGKGVPENDAEAVRLIRASAEQGNARGQFNLGYMYANGIGVPENYVAAYAWYNLAAAQGIEEAEDAKDRLSPRMTSEQVARAQELSAASISPHPLQEPPPRSAPSECIRRESAPENDPAREIQRLRDQIRTCRDEIEAGRATELGRAGEAYRSAVASVAPRDMFETEEEYREREAREMNRASLNRAESERGIHRESDALLGEYVEPLIRDVRSLLARPEPVPDKAVSLDEYDAEREVFVGSIAIDSDLLDIDERLVVPASRASARELWEDRDSVTGELSLSMDAVSLDLQIDAVWISGPSSRSRIRGFIAQDVFMASAGDVAAQAIAGLNRCCYIAGNHRADAIAAVRAYNHLLLEAKLVLTTDGHIQALKTLPNYGSEFIAAETLQNVRRAAQSLQAYLTSFRSADAFEMSARDLAGYAAWAEEACCPVASFQHDKVNVVIGEYNRLIGEAESVFATETHIRALEPLAYHDRYAGGERAAWNSVVTAARRLQGTFERAADPHRGVAGRVAAQPGSLDDTPLNYLPYSGRFSPDARKLAIVLGRPLSAAAADPSGWTDLHYAAALNLDQLASALLDEGANPNAEVRGTPYEADAILPYFGVDLPPLAGELRSTGNPDVQKLRGARPLHIAAMTDAEPVAARLLSANADVAAPMSRGETPLHVSASSASRGVAALLLERGAAVNAKDREGWPPLYYAQVRCESGDVSGGLATHALLERYGGECGLQVCAFTRGDCVVRRR
ncbi:MAG: ankyrin repeat domain-containing protein [Gemmatimonadetes bacterium]|nr:ankyrin repeat domain-containing protein [Gemmatimonadota bacterium]